MKSDILFYIGSVLIIALFVFLLIGRFKDIDEIDLKEHKWIIAIYIVLLLGALTAWRKLYLIIILNTLDINRYNEIIERVING